MVWPLNFEMAFCASSSVPMVTKANPRDLPVNRSCMRVTPCTAPACEKSSCSSFSVVLNETLRTYNLIPTDFILDSAVRALLALNGLQFAIESSKLTIHQLPGFQFLLAHL